jgi:Glutathione peroxidase
MLSDRRGVLTILAGALVTPPALAQAPMTRVTAYAFSFAGLEGSDIKLAEHAGRPILVVNTASLCGYTPQYAGLQQLWTRYRERGLMIVAVPSKRFWRAGARRRGRDRLHRARPIRHWVSTRRQSAGQGAERTPVLQMGGGRAPARHATLEFSQISGRP